MNKRLVLTMLLCALASGQRPDVNYDETKVPAYKLPELLKRADGAAVRDAQAWERYRRPEVFRLLESQMFGRSAPAPTGISYELWSIDKEALGGTAIRKEIDIKVAGKVLHLLLYLPAGVRGPFPVFVGLNFQGNHTVNPDAGVRLAQAWRWDKARNAMVHGVADTQTRGGQASRWQVEKIIARGYGLATVFYGDIEPDFDGGVSQSVRAAYLKPGETTPGADEWGAVAAWAWGMSRVVDYLETDNLVDSKRVAVMGHSRLGKAALWAGAVEPRFAMVISNDSGEGGAAISRRLFGETVNNLNTSFPHWFCTNYRKYSNHEADMPFDSHMLLALIAPRPLYVASAEEDQWADPKGEFLAAVAASPVYELFGKKGIGTNQMPPVHQPVGEFVRYHVRAGKHDVTEYDWEQYLNFADLHFRGKR